MRQLPGRKPLPPRTQQRLVRETGQIESAVDPEATAERLYGNARSTRWFEIVVRRLREMAGEGERCMFCSGSESSEVEHFRPKSVFPSHAMRWENFLWSCGMCNRAKGNRFPPETGPGGQFINPVDENVWDFFTLDMFGNLLPQWRLDLDDLDPRAVSTCDHLQLDRQALQESRMLRRQELIRQVEDSLARFDSDELTEEDLVERRESWLRAPFQPDVADFYLNGPGQEEEPFRQFLAAISQSS